MNSLAVIASKTDKKSIEEYGSAEKFLESLTFLFGQQAFSGEHQHQHQQGLSRGVEGVEASWRHVHLSSVALGGRWQRTMAASAEAAMAWCTVVVLFISQLQILRRLNPPCQPSSHPS